MSTRYDFVMARNQYPYPSKGRGVIEGGGGHGGLGRGDDKGKVRVLGGGETRVG